jgi:hypothetical protein
VYVIGHNHSDVEIHALVVLMETSIQYDETDLFGKDPVLVSAESEKVRFGVSLQMRKLTAIKSPRHDSCGDSRPRLSGGARLRSWIVVGRFPMVRS